MTKLNRFGRPIRPYVPMPTRNSKGEDHGQFAARVKPASPCNSLHETFGGKCLNCGFQPTQGEPNHGSH